jgi:hypothetical protein
MSKSPIKWHEKNLKNSRSYEQQLRKEVADLQSRIEKLAEENKFREYQITEAKRLGMDGFDEEKFRHQLKGRMLFLDR